MSPPFTLHSSSWNPNLGDDQTQLTVNAEDKAKEPSDDGDQAVQPEITLPSSAPVTSCDVVSLGKFF